jgi:molybdenum cofactor guanylyltransferase
MRVLGAVLAGGQSRRFGSDKAVVEVEGKALIDHVIDSLFPQVDEIVVVGRSWREWPTTPDHPKPALGPLGGLAGALRFAQNIGCGLVLTVGCDTLPIPKNLKMLLGEGPTVIEGHWLFGLWPVSFSAQLDGHVMTSDDRSMRGWITASGARHVHCKDVFHNINTRGDLDELRRR